MTRVLLVCNAFDDKWIGSLVRNIKKCDPSILIDVYNTSSRHTGPIPYASLCEHLYLGQRFFPNFLYKLPIIRALLFQADLRIGFRYFANAAKKEGRTYSVTNFSFLFPYYLSFVPYVRRLSNKIALTPWGSDILRRSQKDLVKLCKLVQLSDYITCSQSSIRFYNQVKSMLSVPAEKIIDTDFGDEIIDLLVNKEIKDKELSKERFGINGKYIIVCGYNASPAQNHIKIIDAIYFQKDKLPNNICLLFPMTYGGYSDYYSLVERRLQETNIPHIILRNYLSLEDVAHIRICADMFIHAQTTDANSGSVSEHLLCKTKVINAAWINYLDWEKYGVPYYVFNSFDELGATIVTAYQAKDSLIDDMLIEEIKQQRKWSSRAQQWCDFYNACAK